MTVRSEYTTHVRKEDEEKKKPRDMFRVTLVESYV